MQSIVGSTPFNVLFHRNNPFVGFGLYSKDSGPSLAKHVYNRFGYIDN